MQKEEIAGRARGQWRRIISELGGVADSRLDGSHGPCPQAGCGGTDRFRFTDFGGDGGAVCSQCFESRNGDGFAVLQWLQGWTFPEALKRVAQWLGMDTGQSSGKPSGRALVRTQPAVAVKPEEKIDPWESVRVLEATAEELRAACEAWAAAKPGCDPEALLQSGVRLAEWPAKSRDPQRVLVFPGWSYDRGVGGAVLQIVAAHMYRADGTDFPATGGDKPIKARKNHNARGSASGWIFVGGRERFEAADVVHKVEGLTDAFALLPLLPPHHAVVTTTTGCQWRIGSTRLPPIDIFLNKRVIVWGDADAPGQRGQDVFANDVRRYALQTFYAFLPFAVAANHGPDLRDWMLLDEWTIDDVLRLVREYDEVQRERLRLFGAGMRQYPPRSFALEDCNDRANAKHFVANAQHRLRYCHQWKKWLVWDGFRWGPDAAGVPMKVADQVAAEIWEDARVVPSGTSWAMKSSSGGAMQQMVNLAKPHLPVAVDDLDSNVWLLNCPNGTIDLRTGRLLEHRQEHLITKLACVDYDPSADCPRWMRFLNEVFEGCEDVIPFLARYFGYALTGSIREQQFPVLWGSGSNGKSTFMNTIQEIVGHDYALQQRADLLIAKRGDPHPSELAVMFGKRLVIMSETDEHDRLAEAKVKALTGGEPIPCRRMNEDWWSYLPEFSLVLVTNHRPQVHGQDHAIWRRLLLVPFQQTFQGDRKDPDLLGKLVEEHSGILNWMVRGCLEWQQIGLSPPPSVVAATREYASDEDVIGRFVRECCVRGSGFQVRSKAFHEAFEAWADDNGEPMIGKKKRSNWLVTAGFSQRRSDGIVWCGLGLVQSGDVFDGETSEIEHEYAL